MSTESFRHAEDEYFRLKGQLAAGRITPEQFEAAIRNLMVQDAQGRYWMLGPDSGKWYVHDGKTWVGAQPPVPGLGRAEGAGGYVPAAPPSAEAQPRGMSSMPILAISGVVILCLIGMIALLLASTLGILKIGMVNPTPTLVPFSTIPVFSTLPATMALPTAIPPTVPVPSAMPPTPISPIPSATTVLPTLAPTVPPTQTPIAPTPTLPPAPTVTDTPTPLPPSATPPPPPGLYVTNVRLEPPSPPPAQDIYFFVTFYNATGGTAHYRWKVLIYKPDNTRNSFGETSTVLPDLPLGLSEQKVGTWRITAGACGDYLTRVGWVDEGNHLFFFTQTNGQIYELPITTCE